MHDTQLLPFQGQNIPTEGQQQTPAVEQDTVQASDQQQNQNQQQTGTQQQTSTTTGAPDKLPQQRYDVCMLSLYCRCVVYYSICNCY